MENSIDAVILTVVPDRWRKVAIVITRVLEKLPSKSEEQIAERITALVATGQLEGSGNLAKWRYSEVRLASKIRRASRKGEGN